MAQSAQAIGNFTSRHAYFIGIDSDGCVFDTMEIKQKECFIPKIVEHFQLQAVSRYLRECAEFVNLHSTSRGINRFVALVKTLELLIQRPEVIRRGVTLSGLKALQDWVASEPQLNNASLEQAVKTTGDSMLQRALVWSNDVNATVARVVHGIPPFPLVRECLQQLQGRADLMVVSQTPVEALEREWREHDLTRHVALIAGQEMGTKAEQLTAAAIGRYAQDKILLVGDAPGDLKASQAVGVLFYPIVPGNEEQAWQRLHDEALERFFTGSYAGSYQTELLQRFERALSSTPPWLQAGT